ncbi:hypothetical protein AVEN_214799-1, partial [Araneus ventricosus]
RLICRGRECHCFPPGAVKAGSLSQALGKYDGPVSRIFLLLVLSALDFASKNFFKAFSVSEIG